MSRGVNISLILEIKSALSVFWSKFGGFIVLQKSIWLKKNHPSNTTCK